MTKQITLANLAEATKQEVFDQVALHMLTQGRQSKNEGGCLYRAGELKCAAGCLIADDEYEPEFDGASETSWMALERTGLVPRTSHGQFIQRLQNIHDNLMPDMWGEELISLAKAFKLSYDVVSNFEGE